MASLSLPSHSPWQTATKAKDKISVVLSERGDPKTAAERHLVLSRENPTIPIGRASKVLTKGFVPAQDNAWFENPVMSREHAELSIVLDNQESPAVYIEDIKSFHGTWHTPNDGLNQERQLQPHQRQKLVTGDIVRFGIDIFRHNSGYFPPCSVDVHIEEMDTDPNPNERALSALLNVKPSFSVPDDFDDIDDEDEGDLFVPNVTLGSSQSNTQRCGTLERQPINIDLTVDSEESIPTLPKPAFSTFSNPARIMSDFIDLTSEAGQESLSPSPIPGTPLPPAIQTQPSEVTVPTAPLPVVSPRTVLKGLGLVVSDAEKDSESEQDEEDDEDDDEDMDMDLPCGSSQEGSSRRSSISSEDGYSSHDELHAFDPYCHHFSADLSSGSSASVSSRSSPEIGEADRGRGRTDVDVELSDSHSDSDESESGSEISEFSARSDLGDEFGATEFEEEVDEANDTLTYLDHMDESIDYDSTSEVDSAELQMPTITSSSIIASQPLTADKGPTLCKVTVTPVAPPFSKPEVKNSKDAQSSQPAIALTKTDTVHVRDPSPSDAALCRRTLGPNEQRAQILGEKSGKYEYFKAREDNRANWAPANVNKPFCVDNTVSPLYMGHQASMNTGVPPPPVPVVKDLLSEGDRFLHNPRIDELPPVVTSQDSKQEHDMTSAYTYSRSQQQSQLAAARQEAASLDHKANVNDAVRLLLEKHSSSVPQRVNIANLLNNEPKHDKPVVAYEIEEPSIAKITPVSSQSPSPRAKRSFQEAFLDELTAPRSPVSDRPSESDNDQRSDPNGEQEEGLSQLIVDQQEVAAPEPIVSLTQPEVGRPSKKLRLAQAGACVLLGGAAAFSFLVNTAPVF